jgi:hypothetical protein
LYARQAKVHRKSSNASRFSSANLIRWGVFRLTDPPGMQSVLNCRQTGLFHPHSEPDVYTDALRPGHVFEAKGLEFEVVDQRPGY